MIEQQGTIDAVDGELAWVRVGGRSGCPACDAGKGCGAGVFGRLLQRRQGRVAVRNRLDLQPGKPVLLGLPEHVFLRLVMRLYGWPLVAGFAFALVAWRLTVAVWAPGDWRADVFVGLAALAGGGLALYLGRRSLRRSFTRFSPVMLDPDRRLDCWSSDRHS